MLAICFRGKTVSWFFTKRFVSLLFYTQRNQEGLVTRMTWKKRGVRRFCAILSYSLTTVWPNFNGGYNSILKLTIQNYFRNELCFCHRFSIRNLDLQSSAVCSKLMCQTVVTRRRKFVFLRSTTILHNLKILKWNSGKIETILSKTNLLLLNTMMARIDSQK